MDSSEYEVVLTTMANADVPSTPLSSEITTIERLSVVPDDLTDDINNEIIITANGTIGIADNPVLNSLNPQHETPKNDHITHLTAAEQLLSVKPETDVKLEQSCDITSKKVLENSNSNNSKSNSPLNLIQITSTGNTTVEQPNNGPCMCFICGKLLSDAGERFSYLKNQKLFSMQLSLLDLLSEIISQTVVTNTDSVDLCSRCSELINETDTTFNQLNKLKKQVVSLFQSNQRPKLTFHMLPKSANLNAICGCVGAHPYHQQSNQLDFSDLALTRPRRGRFRKKNKEPESPKLLVNKTSKNKGGRPRKPFPCNICRRKFLTKGMVDSHVIKEHDVQPEGKIKSSSTPVPSPSINMNPTSQSIPSLDQIKLEHVEEAKEKLQKFFPKKIIPSKKALLPSSYINRPILPTPTVAVSKLPDPTSQLVANMRPIQPKPQTMVQTTSDGSLVFFMNPTAKDSSPAVIKFTPGYMSMKSKSRTCEFCNKTFRDDKSFRMHCIAAHGVRKRKRDVNDEDTSVCKYSSSTIEGKKDMEDKMWECGQCEAIFSSKKLLAEHKRGVHSRLGAVPKDPRREKLYSCMQCDQIFNYKYEVERHRETHLAFNKIGPHEFVCCICGLKVASKAALKIHIHRFHSKENETKDYLCSECGYMAGTKKAFSDHQRIHNDTPGPKTRCQLCQKEMLASSYKIHMTRMHGEARLHCETCGQRFTVRSDLMRHMNSVHSSLRPYNCDICKEKFVTSDALRYV